MLHLDRFNFLLEGALPSLFDNAPIWFTLGLVQESSDSNQLFWSYHFPNTLKRDSEFNRIAQKLEAFKIDLKDNTYKYFTIYEIYHGYENRMIDSVKGKNISSYLGRIQQNKERLPDRHVDFVEAEGNMLNYINKAKFNQPFNFSTHSYFPVPLLLNKKMHGIIYLIFDQKKLEEIELEIAGKYFILLAFFSKLYELALKSGVNQGKDFFNFSHAIYSL